MGTPRQEDITTEAQDMQRFKICKDSSTLKDKDKQILTYRDQGHRDNR